MSQFVKQLRESKYLSRGTAAKKAKLDALFDARFGPQNNQPVEEDNQEITTIPVVACDAAFIPIEVVFDEGDVPEDDGLEDDAVVIPDDSNGLPFYKRLKSWALSTHQKHSAINSLLDLLRETTVFDLPKDARTLLGTPKNIGSEIVPIPGGRYWYQGIEKSLQDYFR
uniref:Uncharacterized protein n=1 Tax=Anopheles atroparvus TaxID=41427 RepID=A0A182ILG3_ANOAO